MTTATTSRPAAAPSADGAAVAGLRASADLSDFLPALRELDLRTRRELLDAGREVLDRRRVLAKVGLNVVGEVLSDQGDFVEVEH